MKRKSHFWFGIVLLNLMLVALVGVMMRYKIIAPLPELEQRNLMHGHSHFAFNGWVSMTLLLLFSELPGLLLKHRNLLFGSYLFASLMELGAFVLTGYSVWSLGALMLFQIPLIWMIVQWSKQLKSAPLPGYQKTAIGFGLLFQTLAQSGLILLTCLMIFKGVSQPVFLGNLYFYLHFSYNGWFFFGVMAVMLALIKPDQKYSAPFHKLIVLMGILTIPAFLLSLLWLNRADWLHGTAFLASAIQLVVYFYLLRLLMVTIKKVQLRKVTRILWTLSGIALSLKFCMQFFSNFEIFEQIAFSHRAIVIGYLHLVLLGFVTLFLVGYLIETERWTFSRPGVLIFTAGILLNEILLMIQGVLSIKMQFIPSTNKYLFVISLIMLSGIVLIFIKQWKFTR